MIPENEIKERAKETEDAMRRNEMQMARRHRIDFTNGEAQFFLGGLFAGVLIIGVIAFLAINNLNDNSKLTPERISEIGKCFEQCSNVGGSVTTLKTKDDSYYNEPMCICSLKNSTKRIY